MEDEDSVQTVQDLLNRFRGGGGEAAENKKREYQRSQSDSTDSPKTPRKDEAFPALSGKYILRSARTEDPLHFIHRIRQHSHELEGDRDPEMEDLVTIIRSAAMDDLEEVSEQRESLYQDSVITAPLVKQFNPLPSEEPAHRGKKAAHHEVPVPRPRNLERSPKPPLASFDSDLELEDSPGPKVKDQSHDQSHDFQWRSHDSDDDDEESSEVSQSDDSYDDDDDNNPDNNNDDKEEKIEDARQSSDENEFEQASESDEKRPRESQSESSDHVFTMTTEEEEEPMSVKEQLADWEEEKERPEQEEEEDDGSDDVIGDLETVSTEIDKRKTKERASNSSLDATELDFSVIETSNPLNHEASRQKVILRQKGSLAKRRKPTRSSIRASGMDHDLYGESMATEPRRHPIPPNMMNGHDVEAMERSRSRSHKSSSGSSEEEQERAEEREDTQAGPALRTGKAIGGVKTPILLPGLGDALNKPKLRSSRPPVPPPGESTSSPPVDNTPPWLVEARLRRASKPSAAPPRGEAEKMKQETEPEKPPWMKESMARRKRLIEPPKYGRPDPTKDTTEEQPLAPWMREENLQRSNRPAPLKASHSIVTNSDKSKTESVQQDSDMVSDNKDTSLDLESPRTRTGREVLSPIRHTPAPPMEETEQDENTPPIGQDRNENLMFPSEELPQKSTLPPLRSSPAPQSTNKDHGSETDDSPQPSWMAEIAARRKSKSYIHPVKPDSPMKLVETPQWKLDLAEKKKLRRESQPDIVIPPKVEESSPSSSVPPWKQELDQRKKRTSIGGGRVLDPLPTEKTEEVPEWTKLVQRRRSRLANSGIIRTDQEDVSQ